MKFLEANKKQEKLNKKFIRWRTMVLLGIFDVFVMLGEKKFKKVSEEEKGGCFPPNV